MIPKLIHPVDCVILQLKDKASINYDEDFEEPIDIDADLYDSENPITINAQVRIFTWDELQAKLSGYDEKARGYLLCKKSDGSPIKKSDKIITIADETVENYVLERRPATFYNKKFHFYKLIFMSKEKGVRV